MSFLYRTSTIAVRSVRPSPRLFSTSVRLQKDPVDATKDVLKKVDRTVSDAAVSGIEAGQKAAAKARETAGIKSSEASGKASELSGEAKGKASEVAGEAKGKKEELKGKL